jgi:hypothetical protein
MQLNKLNRKYNIYKTCALNGDGVETAVEWIASIIKTKLDKAK